MRTVWMRFLIVATSLATAAWPADLAVKKALTLEIAKKVAAAAEAHAVANQWNVVIAIVDDGGNLMYLERMDETQLGSIDVAQEKARTAARFKRPTKALEDAVAGGRNVVLRIPGVLPVEGGLPLVAEGKIVGAIGVSGVTSQQDGTIGKAGADALAKILGKAGAVKEYDIDYTTGKPILRRK